MSISLHSTPRYVRNRRHCPQAGHGPPIHPARRSRIPTPNKTSLVITVNSIRSNDGRHANRSNRAGRDGTSQFSRFFQIRYVVRGVTSPTMGRASSMGNQARRHRQAGCRRAFRRRRIGRLTRGTANRLLYCRLAPAAWRSQQSPRGPTDTEDGSA
jgi:hypothetical protein